jgi:ABC-2 type transport system permease protein
MTAADPNPAPNPRGGLWPVVARELGMIAHSPFMLLFVFILPLAMFGLLAAIFYQEIPRDLPVAVCDRDDSVLSRRMARCMDAAPALAVTNHVRDVREGASLIRQGRAYALVYLPAGLESDALRGEAPAVTVYFNNQWLLTSGVINRAVRDVVGYASAGADVRTRMARGESPAQALEHYEPIRMDQHLLFNPNMNYRYFLLPALLPVMLQIFIVVVMVRATGGEFRHGTAGDWLAAAGGRPWLAILGKALPYTLSFFVLGGFMWSLLIRFCNVPLHGELWMLLAGTAVFVLAYQSMGCFFVGLSANLRMANTVAGFYCGPAFAFAGITFPVVALPLPAQCWSNLLPLRHYVCIIMQQAMQGAPVQVSGYSLLALAAFILVPPLVFIPRMGRFMRDPSCWGRL